MFAWLTPAATLLSASASGNTNYTISLRANTATGGSSVDVPTWAAGCVITVSFLGSAMGTSTYLGLQVLSSLVAPGQVIYGSSLRVAGVVGITDVRQVVVPFFDEPSFTASFFTDGTGSASLNVFLMGFVRNV